MRVKVNSILSKVQWNMFNIGLDCVGNIIQDIRHIVCKGV